MAYKLFKGGRSMSESNKKLKHFIIMRFFTFNDPKYPYDIYDVNFLSQQIILARNALGSLENQTNKNFELVFMVNDKFFDDPKYEFIFSSLQDSTSLPLTFIKKGQLRNLIKNASNEYDFIIQSRMDFDDFAFKDAITDIQNKVDECVNILVYGYCKGYIYLNGNLYDTEPYNEIGHRSILQSVITKSDLLKKYHYIGVYTFDHAKIKLKMKNFFEEKGLEFSESMFQQNISTVAYIYFRHTYSHFMQINNYDKQVKKAMKRYSSIANITKKQLEEEFGFFRELNSIK